MRYGAMIVGAVLLAGCTSKAPAPAMLQPAWSALGSGDGETFGIRAMGAGDLNGDGFDELVVGAPGFERHRGRAAVYFGSAQGLGSQPAWMVKGTATNDSFGDRVGTVGDVNGDGFDDLFVASPGAGHGLGRVGVYYGAKRGLAARPDWSVTASVANTYFGDCTHPTGDLNGDGYDDLAVGSYGFDEGRGQILLFNGGPQGLSRSPVWRADGEAKHDWYGYGIGAAGDVNGDGIDDLQAGAKYNDQAGHDAGKAYVYLGGRQGVAAAPDWTWFGPRPDANATVRITTAGDVNGDGYDDLLVTAPGSKGDGRYAYIFFGGPKGLSSAPDQALEAPQPHLEFFGEGAAPIGDLDGDGYDDVALHGRATDGFGQVFIYRGGPKGLQPSPAWILRGQSGGDRFGWWLAPAGDLDGDGRPDLVVSAETYFNGAVYVYYGRQFPRAEHRVGRARPRKAYLHARRSPQAAPR